MTKYKCPRCGSTDIRPQRVNDIFGIDAFDEDMNVTTDELICIDCSYSSDEYEFEQYTKETEEDEDS